MDTENYQIPVNKFNKLHSSVKSKQLDKYNFEIIRKLKLNSQEII